ncbi:hypothetical protein ACJD0Z_17070 [Flavobacteriaceae bacterium M23B6Z8]
MNLIRIKIAKNTREKILEIVSFLLIVGSIVFIALYYERLPEQIHLQVNWFGKDANGLSPREDLWIIPVIFGLIVMGIYKLNQYPWLFNYPVRINKRNARYYYRQATRMLRYVSLALGAGCFILITISIAETLKISNFIYDYIIPTLCTLLMGIPVFYMLKMVFSSNINIVNGIWEEEHPNADTLS